MITHFKKAIYISTSILLTNAFIFNSNGETNTAADIVSGIANIANVVANQQENNDIAAQSIIPEVVSGISIQNEETIPEEVNAENITSEPTAQVTEPVTENNEQSADVQNTAGTEAETAKTGFIDQNGNILIAPNGTAFPSEMKDGEIYYFSRDVEKAKEDIKNNTFPQLNPNAQVQNGMMPGTNGQVPPMVNPMNNGRFIPGQIPQVNPNAQAQNEMIPSANGQISPMVNPMNNGRFIPGQIPQVNSNAQAQNEIIPGTNGQVSPIVNPMNNGAVNPEQIPQVNPNTQHRNGMLPSANKPVRPMANPMNGGAINPEQMPQVNPNTQQAKEPVVSNNSGLENGNQKPIMFQCYLA